MTSNCIKLIACISMLIDHMGVILFPQTLWLRYIGRLAMPLFAFCIAEGCLHTKNPRRYVLRMLALGIACQAVYTVEELLNGGLRSIYLNILFTFSFAALVCFAYLQMEKALTEGDSAQKARGVSIFVGALAAVLLFALFCRHSRQLVGLSVTLDYGAAGILLPLFGLARGTHLRRISVYAAGLVLFCLALADGLSYIWFALFDLPILYFYNGKRGKRSAKYAFYIFYPLHLGVLYLVASVA